MFPPRPTLPIMHRHVQREHNASCAVNSFTLAVLTVVRRCPWAVKGALIASSAPFSSCNMSTPPVWNHAGLLPQCPWRSAHRGSFRTEPGTGRSPTWHQPGTKRVQAGTSQIHVRNSFTTELRSPAWRRSGTRYSAGTDPKGVERYRRAAAVRHGCCSVSRPTRPHRRRTRLRRTFPLASLPSRASPR